MWIAVRESVIPKIKAVVIAFTLWGGAQSFAVPAYAVEPSVPPAAVEAVRGFTAAVSLARQGVAAEGERMTALGAALDQYVDFDRISLRVLGPYGAQAAPDERAEVGRSLRDYLVKRLAGFVLGRSGEPITFGEAFETAWGDKTVVTADIAFAPGNSRIMAFFLSRGATPRIHDVIVSGISAVETLSAECQSIMRRDGAQALLVRLNQ